MTRTIYIVDDDDAVRASLHGLLTLQPNLIVRGYRSGDAFLADAAELESGVVLLDMRMPGANGMDVLKAIRSAPRLAAIILTGQGNIALAVQAMKEGALDFIEKPYAADALLELIEDAFSRLQKDSAAMERIERAEAKVAKLSPRETDVLKGLIEGRSNKIIAHEHDISPRTVEIYRANLMDKLEVRSLSEALRIAFAAGLFPDV